MKEKAQQRGALIGTNTSVKQKKAPVSQLKGTLICTSTSVKQMVPMSQQKGASIGTNTSTQQKLPLSHQDVVTLYNKHHQPVGCGKVVHSDAHLVHGRKVREDCVKVIIEYIQPGTSPPCPSAFDEDEALVAGQFTMWPKDRIGSAQLQA